MAIFGDIRSVMEQAARMPRLRTALQFVLDVCDGDKSDVGRRARGLKAGESFEVPIEGKEIFAIFQAYAPRHRKDGFFEAHKHYTDIQLLLAGEEYIEVRELSDFSKTPAYDTNENVFFALGEKSGTSLHLGPGTAAVLFPTDAHAPCLESGATGTLNIKLVIKVKNALL
jgi:YhcH/YjgK/YiaL family protein